MAGTVRCGSQWLSSQGSDSGCCCGGSQVEGLRQAGSPQRAVESLRLAASRPTLRAQREQCGQVDAGVHAHAREHEGEVFGRRVAAGARRVRAAADAGERSVEAGDADVRAPRRRWPAPGRACRGSGRTRSGRRRSSAPARTAAHRPRIGVADGVGQAHAVGAGVEQRLQQAQHLGCRRPRPGACSRRPCRRRPRSASSCPTHRARRGCAPVRRRPRRASCAGWPGCARGWPTAAAASGRRRRRGHARRPSGWAPAPHATEPGQRLGIGQHVTPCRPAAAAASGRHERADLDLALARPRRRRGSMSILRSVGRIVRMLCSPSRKPTSRITACAGNDAMPVSCGASPSLRWRRRCSEL